MRVADARRSLLKQALVVEAITIVWMVLEAVVAIGASVASHSVSLLAFGADSVIELGSAVLLVWRLTAELGQAALEISAVEDRARRISSLLLYGLSIYVVVGAALSVLHRQGQAFSLAGLAITSAAVPVMYVLARVKLNLASRIGSRALRADAVESLACGWLSAVVLVGLLVQRLFPSAWWVDAGASLAIVVYLLREAREAWDDEDCTGDPQRQ